MAALIVVWGSDAGRPINGSPRRFWRTAPGFSQRFTGTFADGGDTIVGRTELCQDDTHWEYDLQIIYRRQP